jgi:hypothetical protein
MKTLEELNIIAEEKYGIEEGLWFDFTKDDLGIDFCHGEALSILLKEEIVWINNKTINDKIIPWLLVNTNDVFMWACGDAEDLEYDQIEPLIKLVLDNLKWGSTKWACIVNNMQPQGPIVRDMKIDKYWDDELETLPKNKYDK